MQTNNTNLAQSSNGKTIAIISYLTIIGTVIAFVMNKNNPSSLGSFHLRQSIGLTILSLLMSVVGMIPVVGGIVAQVAGIVILVGLIVGLIAAIKEQEKPLPVVGDMFQKWFAGI